MLSLPKNRNELPLLYVFLYYLHFMFVVLESGRSVSTGCGSSPFFLYPNPQAKNCSCKRIRIRIPGVQIWKPGVYKVSYNLILFPQNLRPLALFHTWNSPQQPKYYTEHDIASFLSFSTFYSSPQPLYYYQTW